MTNDDQAEADTPEDLMGADPNNSDTAHNPDETGATSLADYQAEVNAILESGEQPDQEEDEPADLETDEGEETEDQDEDPPNEEEEEDPENEEQEEEEQPPAKSSRYRFSNPADQAIAALAKAHNVSLLEAAKLYEAASPKKQEDDEKDEETQPSRTAATVKQEIDDLIAKKKEAMTNLEFEAVADLDEKLEVLREERADLRVKETTATAAKSQKEAEALDAAFDQSMEKATAHYPDLLDPESALFKKVKELDERETRLGGPLADSPDKPLLLAKAAAKELGIVMADPKAAKAEKKKTPVSRRPVPPASGNARTTAPADPAAKLEKALATVKTQEDYDKFMEGLGVGGF